ncbi:lysine biosynthesis protein LysW [Candidatus Woesearchaeota archaeon]|nr:lysine biosynthesis protein LysW [Candidatus Woesearchaeota archaeon]
MAECPECGAEIELKEPEVGEVVNCPECGAELEIKKIKPLTLELAPEADEDWGE